MDWLGRRFRFGGRGRRGQVGLAAGLRILLGLAGTAGMGGSEQCWMMRRVRSATCPCKAAIWACKTDTCSGSVSKAAARSGTGLAAGIDGTLAQGNQAALMQASEHVQVLLTHPFFAAIVRMAVQRDAEPLPASGAAF